MSNTTPAIYHNGHFYGNEVGNMTLMDNKLNKLSDNIAPKQDSDTASKLIDVGEYFINKDGYLCQCDIQIANQGAITVGTNCHVIPNGLANELSSKFETGRTLIFDHDVTVASYEHYYLNDVTKNNILDNAKYVLIEYKVSGNGYAYTTLLPWFGGNDWVGGNIVVFSLTSQYAYLSFIKDDRWQGIINDFMWYGAVGNCKLYAIT